MKRTRKTRAEKDVYHVRIMLNGLVICSRAIRTREIYDLRCNIERGAGAKNEGLRAIEKRLAPEAEIVVHTARYRSGESVGSMDDARKLLGIA